MLRRIGNAGFRALSDVLDLPGTTHLADVDISAAFATIPLLNMMREELVTPWTFQLELTHLAADSTNARISPYVFTDWTNVFKGSRELTSPEVPQGEQVLFVDMGITTSAPIDAIVIEHRPTTGSGITGTATEQLYLADGLVQSRPTLGGQSPLLQPLPWATIWATWVSFNTPGAGNMILTLTALTGPRGLLPRTGYEL